MTLQLLALTLSSPAAGYPLLNEYLALMGGPQQVYGSVLKTAMSEKDALLVIDCQQDFLPRSACNPLGGALGVAEGEAVMPHVAGLIASAADAGAMIVATRDYHPHDHSSFESQGS